MSAPSNHYYDKGSEEVATETALTVKRLEARRKLTGNSKRLILCLCGLPGRGKSFVARKLLNFLIWTGMECKIFNVGRYRREAAAQRAGRNAKSEREAAGACDANFFDSSNTEAVQMREYVAELALRDMLKWLDEGEEEETNGTTSMSSMHHHSRHLSTASISTEASSVGDGGHNVDRIAIFDATNSTVKRRQWILEECTSPEKRVGKPTGVVFVESICDDQELLEENFRYKVVNSPDFKGMGIEEAMKDLRDRVTRYEECYETIADDSQSYIKIFNLSTKLLVNHVYGRMARTIVPALMAWNIGTRPIFLCRPGETPHGVRTDAEDYVVEVDQADPELLDMSIHAKRKSVKGHSLGPAGVAFRDALYDFIENEGIEFVRRRQDPDIHTGTSLSGLAKWSQESLDFPISVYTSTMPRALQTVEWARLAKRVDQLSNLNPIDKGDFNGLELDEIKEMDPLWYSCLEQDPFHTRFPGGECYWDMIHRLESVVIEMEQQVVPVLIVSHLSTLQVLIAYLRGTPVEKSVSIEVPLHTVFKYTPSRGGGWSETVHQISPVSVPPLPPAMSASDMSALTSNDSEPSTPVKTTPIWGDPVKHSGKSALA